MDKIIDKIKEANDPNMIDAFEAAMKTVANPSAENIIADLEIAIKLIKELKENMGGLHPSVIGIVIGLLKVIF
jgi:hypothetical protein